jgi:DNA-binding NtrC family response regulator
MGNLVSRELQSDVMRQINAPLNMGRIVGSAASLIDVCEKTMRAAQSESTVLILGESGAGKELIAEAIHCHSPRRDKPFVVVNMAAIPESLVESELFGHVKGAFTSAMQQRVGRFEQAQGGTLFIDEIGDFPLTVQAKLLRVLESRRYWSLGSDQEKTADVRVVAATSRPLAKLVQSGAFREDLYFRLNVIPLHLPPLRQRRQDIPLLTDYFLHAYASSQGQRPLRVSPELRQRLEQYDWPGNVRQLRNCIERMCVFARGEVLTPLDLPSDIFPAAENEPNSSRMDSLKKNAILEALEQFGGNRTRAAEFLGISLRTLQRKLREWGMTASSTEGE